MNIATPRRVSHTYVQQLVAPAAEVFPLLCPVREAEWIEGWDPVVVFTSCGVAEPDCVFITRAQPADAVWFITEHQPAQGRIVMIKIAPEVTACKLTIQLQPTSRGCTAEITYSHTSLGPRGDEFLDGFTPESYATSMRAWEERINYYLTHGRLLSGGAG